jgi:serine/threonine protein kinase
MLTVHAHACRCSSQGKPFFSGSSTLNQLEVICEMLDQPDDAAIEALNSKYAKSMYENINMKEEVRKDLQDTPVLQERFKRKFPSASEPAIDLLMQLLRYDPGSRIKPRAGLTHEYCVQFHDPETEILSRHTVGSNPEAAEAGFFDALTESSGVQKQECALACPRAALRAPLPHLGESRRGT